MDWENAFDKVSMEGLDEALRRLRVPTKYIQIIKDLNKSRYFEVEMNGEQSTWRSQQSGIKQGCPLSPYLFLMIMTVISHDMHADKDLEKILEKDEILGTKCHEILLADDTRLFPSKPATLEKRLHRVQEGRKYGLELNMNKSVNRNTGGTQGIQFDNGTKVKEVDYNRYLGCMLNSNNDPNREIGRRLADVHYTWNRLHIFWKDKDLDKRFRLLVYDAAMNAKLLHGLESINLTAGQIKRLESFQIEGIRERMDMQPQIVNGHQFYPETEEVYKQANAE